MVVLRRLLVGLALLIAGVFAAAPQYSVGPISAVDAVVDSIAPQAQALTPSQRIILKRGISPVASWSAATDPFPSAILSHSRTSLATMFDSTGKLTYAPNNLLTYSNTFSNAAWVKSAAGTGSAPIVTPNNATGPDGGANTASTVVFNVGAGTSSGDQSILRYDSGASSVVVSYLGAIYVKGSAGNKILLRHNGVLAYTLFTLTGGWDQLYTKEAGVAATTNFELGIRQGVNGTINSTITVQIAYAALSAVTYETSPRTADQVITTSSAYYGPRIDYDPNTLAVKGLLIEEARTNLFINSGSLSSTSTVSAVKSTDGTLAPDGVTAMTKLTASAATASHELCNTAAMSVTSGGTYTGSIFVKKGNYRYVFVAAEVSSAIGFVAVFDLDNPTTATQTWGVGTGAYSSSRIDAVGGGIYRIQVTGAIGSGTTGYLVAGFTGAATGNSTASSEPSWTAAGTEYGYFFGGQLELDSFATSYIPTAAASVTRAADVVQFTGAASTAIQGSSGALITEMTALVNTYGTAWRVFATSGWRAPIYIASNTTATSYNGSTNLTATAGSGGMLTGARMALSWSVAGRSISVNGGTVATDANSAFGGVSPASAYLGSDNGWAVASGWYKSFAIYNQRLADGTLQSRSVVGASY